MCKAFKHLQDCHFYSSRFIFSPPFIQSFPFSLHRDHLQSGMLISNSLHSILKTKTEKKKDLVKRETE